MSIGDVLFVTALPGGSAEAVLRAMAIVEEEECATTFKSSKNLTRNGPVKWLPYGLGRITKSVMMTGLIPDKDGGRKSVSMPIQFVIGEERGIVLRNDTDHLPHGRRFSINHVLGTETKVIDYVIPVSHNLLHHSFTDGSNEARAQVAMNLRRTTFAICAFLLAHQSREGLIAKRVLCQTIEQDRLARMVEHAKKAREIGKGHRYSRLALSAEGCYVRAWG